MASPFKAFVDEAGQEVDILGDGTLLKKCITPGKGSGTPPVGAKLKVHYVGTLSTGSKFDSSRDRNEPIECVVGKGQVIKGWELGLPTMRKGERSQLTIHHSLAYGTDGKPPTIPPEATLVFDVEVLSWSVYDDVTEQKLGFVKKQTLVEPENEYTKPVYDSKLTVTLHSLDAHDPAAEEEQQNNNVGELKAKELRKNMAVVLGEEAVPHDFETALKSMVAGETARFIVTTGAPGVPAEPGWDVLGAPKDVAAVQFVVTLHQFDSPKQTWQCKTPGDKIHEAEKRKAEGNALYKAKKFRRAVAKYEAGLAYVEGDEAELKQARLPLLTNLAAVQIELQQNFFAAKNCEKALEIDPRNLRALLRKTKANRLRADYDAARSDAHAVLAIDPENQDAKRELELVDKAVKLQKAHDKKTFEGMFDKLAKKAPIAADVAKKEAAAAAPDLEFKENVPGELWIHSCPLPEAVGHYKLNRKKLQRANPVWERQSEHPEVAAWRIFSDPHGRWKFGISTDMESGLGYVKTRDPHDGKLPHEIQNWVTVGADGEWQDDLATVVGDSATVPAGPQNPPQ